MIKNLIIAAMVLMGSTSALAQSADFDSQHPEYLPTLEVGTVAPDFTAADTLGKKASLSDFRGKYVIIDFWATWCGDCRREVPLLKRLYFDLKDVRIGGKELQWVGMSFDNKEKQWRDYLRKEQMPWLQISNLKTTKEDPTFKAYQLHWIPAFFILDHEGKVVAKAITADGLRKAVNNLLEKNNTHLINIWPDGAPTENGFTPEDELDRPLHVSKVACPTLTVYVPEHPTGVAVLAMPGGGYHDVWTGNEGHNMAEWFRSQGVIYAVLKYRLPNFHKEIPLDDVHEAMRILWSHSKEYGMKKLGVMGSSAGGHLAATAATHYSSKEQRPDFQILFYPVITLDPSYTHDGTRYWLLGENPSKEVEDEYCNEKKVTADTPPAIILTSTDDNVVPVANSLNYYKALIDNGVSATMHLYPYRGHGWCGHDWQYAEIWKSELAQWLKDIR